MSPYHSVYPHFSAKLTFNGGCNRLSYTVSYLPRARRNFRKILPGQTVLFLLISRCLHESNILKLTRKVILEKTASCSLVANNSILTKRLPIQISTARAAAWLWWSPEPRIDCAAINQWYISWNLRLNPNKCERILIRNLLQTSYG